MIVTIDLKTKFFSSLFLTSFLVLVLFYGVVADENIATQTVVGSVYEEMSNEQLDTFVITAIDDECDETQDSQLVNNSYIKENFSLLSSQYGVITAGVGVNGSVISINGTTSAGVGKVVSILISDEDGNIVYLKEVISRADNSFSFKFTLQSNALSGDYLVRLNGQGIQEPTFLDFSYNGQISVNLNLRNNIITVDGKLNTGKGYNVSLNITKQGENTPLFDKAKETVTLSDGYYEFSPIMLSDDTTDGIYLVTITCNAKNITTTKKFEYKSTITASVNVNNGEVTISGTTSKGAGKIVSVLVCDKDNNIVYLKEGLSRSDKSFVFEFSLGSTVLVGEYTVLVGGKGVSTPTSLKFTYNEPATYTINVDNNQINIIGKTNFSAGKTITLNITKQGADTPIYQSPKLTLTQQDGSFQFSIPDSDVPSSGTYTVSISISGIDAVIKKNFILYKKDITWNDLKELNIVVKGEKINNIDEKVFSIDYDPQVLQVIDMSSLTKVIDNTIETKISGTDIIITEFDSVNGIIKFKLDKSFEGKQWTGIANIIKFKTLINSGTTSIKVDI